MVVGYKDRDWNDNQCFSDLFYWVLYSLMDKEIVFENTIEVEI